MKFSVAIIVRNLDNPERTAKFANLSDDVVVLADNTTDFAAKRNHAMTKSKYDWVLMIDDDEYPNDQLVSELFRLDPTSDVGAYKLNRKDYYYGERLEYGETGFTTIARLVNKKRGRFVRPVHEYFKTKNKIIKLDGELIHTRFDLTTGFIDRMVLYSPIDAKALNREGKKFSYLDVLTKPGGKFIVNYFLKFGFADGILGLFHAYLMSVQSLTVRVYQWLSS